jgi:glycosyltransferase involved in cell wall biosynthesis
MTQPLVSIIITTYNRSSFLAEALASVLAQDYAQKEVIVVDDGSTDGSEAVVRGLPVRYEWKQNGGISSARNRGIAMAAGDYLAFLDVDDLWSGKKLSTQMAWMRNGEYPISYTDEVWVRNGRHLNQKKRHRKYSGLIYDHCLPLCIISPSSAVIRRDVFETVGLFDESLPVCEDYDMWLRIACRYPILFVPCPLITKRGGHSDQLSRSYEVMDIYRIRSLAGMVRSGALAPGQVQKTLLELTKKCRIVANGAAKRGRDAEARYYESLPHDVEAGLS